MLYLYTNRFSTYAIGIDPEASQPTPTPTPTPSTSTVNPGRENSGSYSGGSSGSSGASVPGVRNDITITPATPTETASNAQSAFSDVASNAWYAAAVNWASVKKVMSGYGDGRFGPADTTTRAMIAQILWNLEGNPQANGTIEFTDVSDSAWYAKAIAWAFNEGIVSGYDDKRFGPEDTVTREQIAAMLYRFAKSKGADTSADTDGKALTYSDAASISAYAESAMRWAVGTGLITGRSSTTLEPKGTATRAEIATIMMRYCTEAAK